MNPRPEASGPHARKTVLANGVRVLTERLEHVDSASLGLWSVSGSRLDPPGREGTTHFLEHMLFKGTATRSALEIGEAIDDIGGYVNGLTDPEHMHLFARTRGEHAERALALLFDLLLHSQCAAEEVARERGVVLQEIAHVRDSPEDWLHEIVPGTAWPDHVLGRSLMGTEDSVRSINHQLLKKHLAELVQVASRLVVTGVGRVDHERIVALTERHTGQLSESAASPSREAPVFHPQQAMVTRPGEQVHFCLIYPGIARTHEARHTFAVLDTLLGGGNSSRLFQEIREKRGLAYSIGSYLQFYETAGLFLIAAGTSPERFQAVLDLVEQELARLRADGPTEEEIARAKIQLKVGIALAAESTGYRMQHIALSEIYWQRVLSLQEIVAGVDGVTAEDVHLLARAMLGDGRRALAAIGPFDSEGGGHG
jgi:predicted Zn-dependent peptidase